MKLGKIFFSSLALLTAVAAAIHAESDRSPLVVMASNAAQNQLPVYNSAGQLIQTIPTRGQGGPGATRVVSKPEATWLQLSILDRRPSRCWNGVTTAFT